MHGSHRPRSGKLSHSRVSAGAQNSPVKEYFRFPEEGRADLMALWNVWDPKLKELGLISNQEEVARQSHGDNAAEVALTQPAAHLNAATPLKKIRRTRSSTCRPLHRRSGSGLLIEQPGPRRRSLCSGDRLSQAAKARHAFAELMRIMVEGDYDAIKVLCDNMESILIPSGAIRCLRVIRNSTCRHTLLASTLAT